MEQERERRRHSLMGFTSWVALALGALLVLAGLWRHAASPTGHWDDRFVGQALGVVVIEDDHGVRAELGHPAIVQVYSAQCRYCDRAASEFWAATPDECNADRYFLITTDPVAPPTPPRKLGCGGAFRILLPARALALIDRVPTTIATNAAGELEAAYVGVPDLNVLGTLRRAALGAAPGGSTQSQPSGGPS